MNKWVSVNDAMPPVINKGDGVDVLILVKEETDDGESYNNVYVGYFQEGKWYTCWCHGHKTIDEGAYQPVEVTHWMRLPELPEM